MSDGTGDIETNETTESTGTTETTETTEEVEDMVRRALEDEAAGYEPSYWSRGSDGVRDRIDRRRRSLRTTVAVSLATAGTAAAAVLGVIFAGGGHSPATTPAADSTGVASAKPSASASAKASASQNALRWPAVRIVPDGKTVVFEHQIWMKLTASERCEGMDLPHGGSSCKSVTDGNQQQDSVGLQAGGDLHGTEYSPLYIGSGDVARMAITVHGITYPATVVKLAGHPGYATAYLWLPNTGGGGAQADFMDVTITVYDAHGAVLATMVPPSFASSMPH